MKEKLNNLIVGNMGGWLHHGGGSSLLECGCLSVHHHFRPITHTQEPTKMAFYCFLNIPIRTGGKKVETMTYWTLNFTDKFGLYCYRLKVGKISIVIRQVVMEFRGRNEQS